MAKVKTFQFIYQVEAEDLKTAICVIREVEENTGMQPTQIIYHDGRVLTYSDYAVHKFVDHGGITEERIVEILSST
jgi:hypothetical protein